MEIRKGLAYRVYPEHADKNEFMKLLEEEGLRFDKSNADESAPTFRLDVFPTDEKQLLALKKLCVKFKRGLF